MFASRALIVLSCVAFVFGCAGTPELPTESSLPIAAIADEAVCQISQAFRDISPEGKDPAYFGADHWTIGIGLTPKTTTDFSVGLNGSATNNPKPSTAVTPFKAASSPLTNLRLPILNWALAPASTGATVDRIGDTTGVVNYTLHSSIFYLSNLKTKDAQLKSRALMRYCESRNNLDEQSSLTNFVALSSDMGPNPHNNDLAFRSSIGIESWMKRILAPVADVDGAILHIVPDQPGKESGNIQKSPAFSYTTHLSLTANGGLSASWTPPGATPHLFGFGPTTTAKRNEDVILAVSFVYDPEGGEGKSSPPARSATHVFGNSQQLIQSIQQLNIPQ